jgi:hypothetical protein
MYVYSSSAKYGPVHVDMVRYWTVQGCIGGARQYLVHADTGGKEMK